MPYFLALHTIFSRLLDEELLLDGAGTVSDSEFEFDIGPVPMPAERCGRLALRMVFEHSAQSMNKKIMACDGNKIVPLAHQGVQTSAQEKKANSVGIAKVSSWSLRLSI